MMKANGRLMAEPVYPGTLGSDGQGLSPLGEVLSDATLKFLPSILDDEQFF